MALSRDKTECEDYGDKEKAEPGSQAKEKLCIPLQLSDVNASLIISQVITVVPDGVPELRALYHNLRELFASTGINVFDQNVDPGTKSKDEPSICAIKYKISSCQKDFPWS